MARRKTDIIPLTVIIPAYGRQHLLDRALASIRRQDVVPVEVLVVDDASEPRIQIRQEDSESLNVRLLRHDVNKGPAAARNTGLRGARTEWVSFLDNDDFFLEESLSARWKLMGNSGKKQPDPKVIYGCGWIDIDESLRPLAFRWPRASSNPYDFASGCWFSPGSCVILNAKEVLSTVLQDEQLGRFEDFDWFMALSQAGFSLQVVPIACVAIERRRSQHPARIEKAAEMLRIKWRRISDDDQLLRRLDAYMDVEVASARYYAGSPFLAATALLRSFLRKPRFSLQPSPGWIVERAHALPKKSRRSPTISASD